MAGRDEFVKPIPPRQPSSSKPVFHITEAAEAITIDFEGFTLIIKKKK